MFERSLERISQSFKCSRILGTTCTLAGFLGTPSNPGRRECGVAGGVEKSDEEPADLAPTLINLGSVTVSDWFLLALSRSVLLLLPTSFLPLLLPQKLYTSLGDLSSPPLILMIIPPIRIEVGRSRRSNLLWDNGGHFSTVSNAKKAFYSPIN